MRFDAQPIHGRVYDRDRAAGESVDRPFSGWLGLIAAIDAAGGAAPAQRQKEDGR